MSDENAALPENLASPAEDSAPRSRRVSTPRPKKVAKPLVSEESAPPEHEEIQAPSADWPEPEAESAGGNATQSESTKRKRRRRKGKGQSANQAHAGSPVQEEIIPLTAPEAKPSEVPQEPRQRQNPAPQQPQSQPPRLKIDPALLTKMAWKIYLAEVSEEGVALIGDNDAKDLSRRCFRLAEIFIEEQARRR